MPKLPQRQAGSQLRTQGASIAPSTASAVSRAVTGLGSEIQNVSAQLGAAEERKRSRGDTISRVQAVNDVRATADKELTRIQSEEDLSRDETVAQYDQFLRQTMAETVDGHQGSQASRDQLAATLAAEYGGAIRNVRQQSTKLQFEQMNSHVDELIKGAANTTLSAPSTFAQSLQSLDAEIDNLAPALTPAQEVATRTAGRSAVIQSAVGAYLNGGDIESAKSIMSQESLSNSLDLNVAAKLRQSITVAEHNANKGQIEAEQTITKAESIIGRPLNNAEKLKLAGLSQPKANKTFGDSISEIESALGRQLTQDEIAKKANIDSPDGGGFGSGVKGRSLEIMNNLSSAVSAGIATPEEERLFETAITEYTQPVQFVNPTTGEIETRQARLPGFAQEAATIGGFNLEGKEEIRAADPENQISSAFKDDPIPDQSGTIWGRRKDVVGIGPSVASKLGRVPVIGEGVGTKEAESMQYVDLRQKTLVKSLQNSPRYAESERESLESTISITGKTFDTESAYTSRVLAVDEFLNEEITRAQADINNPLTTTAIRQAALRDMSNMSHFKMLLGAPPKVKTVDEAMKLPAGTQFVDPDGKLWEVPG